MNFPDHNTINRFRSVRLKDSLRNIFEEVVQLLAAYGLLSIEEVYTDGTKIEVNANKYTSLRKKAIATNKEKMKKQLTEIWQYAQSVATVEDNLPKPPDFASIDKEKVQATVDKLFYNKDKDCYTCPMGQPMNFIGEVTRKTSTGFEQKLKRYQAKNCSTCPLNGTCHKSQGNRIIEKNENLQRHKAMAYDLLNSEEGSNIERNYAVI